MARLDSARVSRSSAKGTARNLPIHEIGGAGQQASNLDDQV